MLMAGAKRRSPTSTLVSKNAISQASTTLLDLPEKPKEIWSLREAINALKDQITMALDRGYSYPEISKMLSTQGVEISASTLKYYLSSVRREDGTKTKRRRTSGKLTEKTLSKATAAVEGAVSGEKKTRGRKPKAVVEAVVEEEPAVAPKKRGRVAAPKPEKAAPKAAAKTASKAPTTRGRRKVSA
jgi:hypothetical protein